jgi:quercetin dioxygenase-like cupin family protein
MLHDNQYASLATWNQPVSIPPSDGEMLQSDGISCQFKVTSDISNDQLGVYQIILQPNTIGAKLHFHRFTDEVFIVLKGTLTVQSSRSVFDAAEGTVIQVPRLTPHAFCNNSAVEAKILLLFNPNQKREGFFRDLFEAIRTKTLETPAFKNICSHYDTFSINIDANKQNEHE